MTCIAWSWYSAYLVSFVSAFEAMITFKEPAMRSLSQQCSFGADLKSIGLTTRHEALRVCRAPQGLR